MFGNSSRNLAWAWVFLSVLFTPTLSKRDKKQFVPVKTDTTTVIGILSQEYVNDDIAVEFPGHRSYIAASYVKAVEASGAQVVPIKIGQTNDYYENIMNHINGLVIPGGAAYFNYTNGYKDAGKTLIKIAEKLNTKGTYFPILGVCLGFELLIHISNNEKDLRTECNIFEEELSLIFQKNGSKTGLFRQFPKKNLKTLSKDTITFNYHIWCVTKASLKQNKLTDKWTILTESQFQDRKFVSTVQSIQFPFVGIQFHPEKSAYEWNTKHVNHSKFAIESNSLFYNWLVEEARKNSNNFSSKEDLYKEIIYNYPAVMTYPKHVGFEQIYFFD